MLCKVQVCRMLQWSEGYEQQLKKKGVGGEIDLMGAFNHSANTGGVDGVIYCNQITAFHGRPGDLPARQRTDPDLLSLSNHVPTNHHLVQEDGKYESEINLSGRTMGTAVIS